MLIRYNAKTNKTDLSEFFLKNFIDMYPNSLELLESFFSLMLT